MILQASPFLSDPAGPSPIIAAMAWVEGTLLGSIATAIAVLCIATVGLMMFLGRAEIRRGLVVVLGCFVLFGAPAIVAGFRGADNPVGGAEVKSPPVFQPPPLPPSPPLPVPTDPYAGASVIRH